MNDIYHRDESNPLKRINFSNGEPQIHAHKLTRNLFILHLFYAHHS